MIVTSTNALLPQHETINTPQRRVQKIQRAGDFFQKWEQTFFFSGYADLKTSYLTARKKVLLDEE